MFKWTMIAIYVPVLTDLVGLVLNSSSRMIYVEKRSYILLFLSFYLLTII